MSLSRVRKRDGRQVPFDESKIAQAIASAMEAVGEADVGFAAEVAGVVRMTLEASYGERAGQASPATRVPTIEEIQDLIEKALVELGRARVAKAFILYRDRRARVREALQVHAGHASARNAGAHVHVTESEGSASWSKGRIVAALMGEADLPRDLAEAVAARVEQRVFKSGLRRLTTSLIRELVDNELVAMGLAAALRKQASVLLPLHDLRRSFSIPPPQPDLGRPAPPEALGGTALSGRVSGEVMRRFALEHVLGEAAAERHLSGDYYVQNLEHPHLVLWTSLVPAGGDAGDGLARELPESPRERGTRNLFEALEEQAQVAQSSSLGLVLDGAESAVATLTRGASLEHWLAALAATARASCRRIDLCFSSSVSARSIESAQRLIRAVDRRPTPASPRLFADVDLLEALPRQDSFDRCFERALMRGSLIPTWSSDQARFAAPGCARRPRERGPVACAGAVALNLPRLARRAGPWREDRLLEGLAELVTAAIEACASLFEFQRSVPSARGSAADARTRAQFALVPIGLREALRILGDGELRPEQGGRVLAFMAEAGQRMSADFPFEVRLSAFGDPRAAQRFSDLDERARRASQQLLFADGAGVELESGAPYSEGYRLTPVPGFTPWAAEAQMCSGLPSGALWPLPEDTSRGGIVSLAEACRRFGALRREPPPSVPGLRVNVCSEPGLFDAPARPQEAL